MPIQYRSISGWGVRRSCMHEAECRVHAAADGTQCNILIQWTDNNNCWDSVWLAGATRSTHHGIHPSHDKMWSCNIYYQQLAGEIANPGIAYLLTQIRTTLMSPPLCDVLCYWCNPKCVKCSRKCTPSVSCHIGRSGRLQVWYLSNYRSHTTYISYSAWS